jgi:hypothetical protein
VCIDFHRPGKQQVGRKIAYNTFFRGSEEYMKKIVINLAKILVTVLVFYLIFKKFDISPARLLEVLKTCNPWWFVASFFTQVGAVVFSICRWVVLLRAQEMKVPLPHLIGTYMIGRFFGTVTPTGIGLEAFKAYDVARYTKETTRAIAVVFIEKTVVTFIALSILVLITLPHVTLPPIYLAIFFVIFIFMLILALVLLFIPQVFEKILLLRFPGKGKIEGTLKNAVKAVEMYRNHKGSLLVSILCGIIATLFLIMTFYTNNLALNAGISLRQVYIVGPLTQIASMIPLSIAGVGLRDGAFVELLNSIQANFDYAAAVITSTMWYIVSISVNIIGAIIFLLRRTDYGTVSREEMDRVLKERDIHEPEKGTSSPPPSS